MNKIVLSLILSITALSAASPGMKVYGRACVECHGDNGKDVSIAGKEIAGGKDILSKLNGYKNGTYGGDQKATMQASLAPLSDDDLKEVAAYVETLK